MYKYNILYYVSNDRTKSVSCVIFFICLCICHIYKNSRWVYANIRTYVRGVGGSAAAPVRLSVARIFLRARANFAKNSIFKNKLAWHMMGPIKSKLCSISRSYLDWAARTQVGGKYADVRARGHILWCAAGIPRIVCSPNKRLRIFFL